MSSKKELHSRIVLSFIILAVAINGLAYIVDPLLNFIHLHFYHLYHLSSSSVGFDMVIGLTLIYLSSLLARRKSNALAISIVVYSLVILINLFMLLIHHHGHGLSIELIVRDLILPIVAVLGLTYYRKEFMVKSDIQGFSQSIPIILVMILVTLIYGVVGFSLMDDRDFHQEISILRALHLTIDQFGLTTKVPIAYSIRAKIFLDSLSTISIAGLVYVALSLFQPIRARFVDQSLSRLAVSSLLDHYAESSEDFFKIWPTDKSYYFTRNRRAALAYRVHRGVALVVSDPIGDNNEFDSLLTHFIQQCRINDWLPAFVHIEGKYREMYERHGLAMQKIGEEAILNIDKYTSSVVNNKYFRHINQKFTKLGYTCEPLKPPHSEAVINQLRQISNDWLELPGRTERGFMMGYFTPEYMQLCNIMVARDEAGTIQAFINQIPPLDAFEANYDLLRHSSDSPGNMGDFLLLNFIKQLHGRGFLRLNMGLCPLSGLSSEDADHSTIDAALRFAYSNGDRLYSFSGLHRFKSKYEPDWTPRYIAYRNGIRGFTKTIRALNVAMKVKNKNS
jgi:phosphatidylglycerol lysyltransferase